MYFHQRGQINFWVPVTKVYDTNTLFVESAPGLQVRKAAPRLPTSLQRAGAHAR